jgi:hypothetical protein
MRPSFKPIGQAKPVGSNRPQATSAALFRHPAISLRSPSSSTTFAAALPIAALVLGTAMHATAQNPIESPQPQHFAYASFNNGGSFLDSAVNRSGDGCHVWMGEGYFPHPQYNLGFFQYQLFVQRTRRGLDVGTPILVTTYSDLFVAQDFLGADAKPRPRCDIDEYGNIVIAWSELRTFPGDGLLYRTPRLCAVRFADGTLSSVVDVDVRNAHQLHPDVAIGPSWNDVAQGTYNGTPVVAVAWVGPWDFAGSTAPLAPRGSIKLEAFQLQASPFALVASPFTGFPQTANTVNPATFIPSGQSEGGLTYPEIDSDASGRLSLSYCYTNLGMWNQLGVFTSGFKTSTQWQLHLRRFALAFAPMGAQPLWDGGAVTTDAVVATNATVTDHYVPRMAIANDGRLVVGWRAGSVSDCWLRAYDYDGADNLAAVAPAWTYGNVGSLLDVCLSNQGYIGLAAASTSATGNGPGPDLDVYPVWALTNLRRVDFATGAVLNTIPFVNETYQGTVVQSSPNDPRSRLCASDTGEVEAFFNLGIQGKHRTRYDFAAVRYVPKAGAQPPALSISLPGRANEAFIIVLSSADYGELTVLPDGRHYGYWAGDSLTAINPNPYLQTFGFLDATGSALVPFTNLPTPFTTSAYVGVFTYDGSLPYPLSYTSASTPKAFTLSN